jgi:hypothetical protein
MRITIETLGGRTFSWEIDGLNEKHELDCVIGAENVLDTKPARLGLPFNPYFPPMKAGRSTAA